MHNIDDLLLYEFNNDLRQQWPNIGCGRNPTGYNTIISFRFLKWACAPPGKVK